MLTIINNHTNRTEFIGTDKQVLAYLTPKYPGMNRPLVREYTHHSVRDSRPEDEVQLTELQKEKR